MRPEFRTFESLPGITAELRAGRLRLSGHNRADRPIQHEYRPGDVAAAGFDGDFLIKRIDAVSSGEVRFVDGQVLPLTNFAFFNQFEIFNGSPNETATRH